MRPVLRISRTKSHSLWRWYREDYDLAGNQVLEESADFTSWKLAREAAVAAHPSITEVYVHAVADTGVRFEDGMPIGVMA